MKQYRSRFWLRTIFLAALVVGGLLPLRPAVAEQPLSLWIHPYLSATEVEARFTPLAKRLGAALGHRVRIVVAESYEDHIEKVGLEQADLAYMGPVSYLKMTERFGAPHLLAQLANRGVTTFHGAIIVREDSAFQTLSDLKGARFAFGSPSSTTSYIVPSVMLHDAGIKLDDLAVYDFVGGHKNVALSVLTGKFHAGGVKMEVFDQFKDRGLRALAMSDAVPEHLFVASTRLSPRLREKARAAMLALHKDRDGRSALRAINPSLTALMPVTDAAYDGLRRILETHRSKVAPHRHTPKQ